MDKERIFRQFPPVTRASDSERCPVRDVLDCIGDKWSVLALSSLSTGTKRFTELKESIGDISPRMLAKTLRTLERDGYVSREVFPTIPPRVDYSLTPLGESFIGVMTQLIDWANEKHSLVRAARAAYVPPEKATAL